MDRSVANASETSRIAVSKDSDAMGELVDSIEAVVKNVSAVMGMTEKKQSMFEKDLERVTKLEATGKHEQWIRNNVDKAALVRIQIHFCTIGIRFDSDLISK